MRATRAAAIALTLLACASLAGAEALSPAQQKIEAARRAIEKNPSYLPAHNDLALALSMRARETSDTSYYDQALEVLQNSYRISKDNFEGRKVEAWILLGKHEFPKALKVATKLNQEVPDDLMIYALLTDAHVELGNYSKAEEAAQWLLNLRPSDLRGLTRGAYLRELFGDIDGAIDFFKEAYNQLPPSETENRAWILTQLGQLVLAKKQPEEAERLLAEALRLFPGYHYTLAGLAKVKTAQGEYEEAAELMRQRFVAAPHPENLYDLAYAFDRAGWREEADALYPEFERKALEESATWDNANRELIFYYVDRAGRPADGLKLAKMERRRRRDIFTLDAYAWALSQNGRHKEAAAEIEQALKVGIRDPKLSYHAGAIAFRMKKWELAGKYLAQCIEQDPGEQYSVPAQELLNQVPS